MGYKKTRPEVRQAASHTTCIADFVLYNMHIR